MADELDPGVPVAWIAMPYKAPVLDREGHKIGTTESLLGDEQEDIFHGLVLRTEGRDLKEIPGARVTRITTTQVRTDLEAGEVDRLPPYEAPPRFRADWGGLFRNRPQWVEEER